MGCNQLCALQCKCPATYIDTGRNSQSSVDQVRTHLTSHRKVKRHYHTWYRTNLVASNLAHKIHGYLLYIGVRVGDGLRKVDGYSGVSSLVTVRRWLLRCRWVCGNEQWYLTNVYIPCAYLFMLTNLMLPITKYRCRKDSWGGFTILSASGGFRAGFGTRLALRGPLKIFDNNSKFTWPCKFLQIHGQCHLSKHQM